MIISFWSPQNHLDSIQGLLSIGIQYSIMNKEILAINLSEDNLLDKLVIGEQYKKILMDGIGTDGLFKLDKLNNYSKDKIELNTLTYLNKNFHYMPGSIKKNNQLITEKIITSISPFYKHIILDLPHGNHPYSMSMLDISDIIIVCLPQNKIVIEEYLENYKMKNKKVYYLITDYDRNSSYNLKNLSQKYVCFKNKITAIPYDINFLDAIYESKGIWYMQKLNILENSFISNVNKASNLILNEWGRRDV